MRIQPTRTWGSAVLVAVAALMAGVVATRLTLHRDPATAEDAGLAILRQLPAFAIAAVVGAAVVRRRATDGVGWLLLALAGGVSLSAFLEGYARLALRDGSALPGAVLATWLSTWSFVPILTVIGALFLVFPDGSLVGPRWRWVFRGLIASSALLVVSFAFMPGALDPEGKDVDNPVGLPDSLEAPVRLAVLVGGLALVVSIAAAAASLVVRWRRSGPGQRRQLAWIVRAAVPLGLLVALHVSVGQQEAVGRFTAPLADLAFTAFFAAVGVAVLRHRLFDVDVVVNRAIVWVLLAGFVTLAYAAAVVGLGRLVGSAADDVWLSLGATAAIAVGFAPVRQRATVLANRLVYGQTEAPYDVLAGLGKQMTSALAADAWLPEIARVAAAGVGAARAEIELSLPDGRLTSAHYPVADAGPRLVGSVHEVAIAHEGEQIGVLRVTERAGAAFTAQQRGLLADLAANAAAGLANVRLTAQLRQRLDELSEQAVELTASRRRLVTAQDDARRRLERDIHDGAQQELVAITLALRTAAATHPGPTGALLDELRVRVSDSLGALRDLARGVYPPTLAELGLVAAVRAHLAKAGGQSATVETRLDPAFRADREVEASVYFCCLEALQNVAKHAEGAPVSVRFALDGDVLVFEVVDRGPGFDPQHVGAGSTGLQGMADRLAALGGRLDVATSAAGTSVSGRIPARPH